MLIDNTNPTPPPAFTSEDQRDFVRNLFWKGRYWLGPMPVGCEHMEPLAERLAGMMFSLFPELEGAGGIAPHRLSPKGRPDVDLVDFGLHDQWPNTQADDPDVTTLLTDVASVLAGAQAAGGEPRRAMGALLVALCDIIERGYELHAQEVDDHGNIASEAEDIAPGLTALAQSLWTPFITVGSPLD